MDKMKEIIGQTIGEASMLWSETPKGIFESDKGVELIDRTVEAITALSIRTPTAAQGVNKEDIRRVVNYIHNTCGDDFQMTKAIYELVNGGGTK